MTAVADRPPKVWRNRYSAYTPEERAAAVERIIAALEEGKSLKEACGSDAALPSPGAFLQWTYDDDALAARYTRARHGAYLAMAEGLVDEARDRSRDNGENGHVAVARSRLIVDTEKWVLAKALPKIFGDRLDVEHSGNVSLSVTFALPGPTGARVTLDDAQTRDATARVLPVSSTRVASLLDNEDGSVDESLLD